MVRFGLRVLTFAVLAVLFAACGNAPGAPGGDEPTLTVGAIPDQDPQKLQRQYGTLSRYLSERLGVEVQYVPVTDYAAAVTSFRRGDLQLVFFGGLTGVQARSQVPGAVPIAQRDIDAEFRSVFVANTATDLRPVDGVSGLRTLAGHSFTFGSEISTSGRLMPQYFLRQAGLTLEVFAGQVGFSGSHDATAKLVEAGTYDAGALNAAVWDARVASGKIDTGKVRVILRTPTYHDYHWLVRPDLDERFGDGFTARVREALLAIDGSNATEREILNMFSANKFIPTKAENYARIESIARSIGLLSGS